MYPLRLEHTIVLSLGLLDNTNNAAVKEGSYGSETWCLRENEMAILRRTERAMVRSMCGVKLVDRKKMEDLMEMLGLKEILDRMATANGVRWYGRVIRRDDDNILKKTMMMEVNGK